jgi:hypothetical protein
MVSSSSVTPIVDCIFRDILPALVLDHTIHVWRRLCRGTFLWTCLLSHRLEMSTAM